MKNTTFYLKGNDIENFRYYLQERESSKATIEKYIRDVKRFTEYAGKHTRIDKEKLLEYKQWLVENYAISSANSMLMALNQFLIFLIYCLLFLVLTSPVCRYKLICNPE